LQTQTSSRALNMLLVSNSQLSIWVQLVPPMAQNGDLYGVWLSTTE